MVKIEKPLPITERLRHFIFSQRFVLIVILILASSLRLWNLSSVPPSASQDEASIGYNAYSLLKTGGDEYGEVPILSHRSYDDWRRATYLYLVTPFVALFGLNVFAIRLPAVILSILTVWAIYHITLYVFSKYSSFSSLAALLAAFLLTINPSHIYISRIGHETNAYLAFLVFGILFFLQGVQSKKTAQFLLSVFFLGLTLVAYYTGQVLIPLLVTGIVLIYRKVLLSFILSRKIILIFLCIVAILCVPLLLQVFSKDALVRFQGTSIFRPEVYQQRFEERMEHLSKAHENNDFLGKILYSPYLFQAQVFFEGYLSHFKPEWLFSNSGFGIQKVPFVGLLYPWTAPFIVIGIVYLLISKTFDKHAKWLIFLWFFLGPLPAAIATQAPHVFRSVGFLPVWQIFTALGLAYAFYALHKYRFLTVITLLIIVLFSLGSLYINYFIIFPKTQSHSFRYAFSKAIPYILAHQDNYQRIVFSNEDNLFQSYMLFLYHSRYNPSLYQYYGGTESGGYAEKHYFGKYEFRPIDWEYEQVTGKTLFVGNPDDFPKNIPALKRFYSLDGSEGLIVVERNR